MEPLQPFPEFQLDVLKEIGNIGSGNAMTALSKLLNKPVHMEIPKMNLVPFEEIAESLGGPEEVVVAIYFRVTGNCPGNMYFILTLDSADELLSDIIGLEVSKEQHYSEMELSALSEIGNIMAGSYLSSLSDFTHLNMLPTVPSLAVDMAGSVLSYGLLQFGQMGDRALFIDTTFLQGENKIKGHFFLIPDPDSLNQIFAALGVPTE